MKRPVVDSKVFALGIEQQPTSDTRYKYLNRVVLINERGDRVLDTLVKPSKIVEGFRVTTKEGIKTKIFQLAADIAPSLETVAEIIANIVKDKPFVGYHQAAKLSDMGYWNAAIAIGGKLTRENYNDFKRSDTKVIGEGQDDIRSKRGHKNRFNPNEIETQHSLFTNLFDTAKIFNKSAHN